jgi:hypothetical protein
MGPAAQWPGRLSASTRRSICPMRHRDSQLGDDAEQRTLRDQAEAGPSRRLDRLPVQRQASRRESATRFEGRSNAQDPGKSSRMASQPYSSAGLQGRTLTDGQSPCKLGWVASGGPSSSCGPIRMVLSREISLHADERSCALCVPALVKRQSGSRARRSRKQKTHCPRLERLHRWSPRHLVDEILSLETTCRVLL